MTSKNEIEKTDSDEYQKTDPMTCIIKKDTINGQIVIKSCKICNSQYRLEVERLADDAGGLSNAVLGKIRNLLESKGENYPILAIKHHIQKHHFGLQEKLTLEEYQGNLVELSKNRRSRFETLEHLQDIGNLELMRCLSMQSNGSPLFEKDRQKMIQDNIRIMIDCIKTVNDMEDMDKKIQAIWEKVKQAFTATHARLTTVDEEKIFKSIVEEFKLTYASIESSMVKQQV